MWDITIIQLDHAVAVAQNTYLYNSHVVVNVHSCSKWQILENVTTKTLQMENSKTDKMHFYGALYSH